MQLVFPFGCPHSFGQVPDGGLEQPQASEAVLPDTPSVPLQMSDLTAAWD